MTLPAPPVARGAPAAAPPTVVPTRALTLAPRVLSCLLFGLRLWVSVCLALYLAFWLELETPAWAGTTAALVCQPHLGASLRKGWFRLVGTILGALVAVLLVIAVPQDRAAFLLGLALIAALAAFAATLLRNFASYAAALAGFTATIIAADVLGPTGGPDTRVVQFAIARATEIGLGIVCAGIVLAGTDLGGARQRLAGQIAALAAELAGRAFAALQPAAAHMPETPMPETQAIRREFVRQATALDPMIDEAAGEASTLRYHSAVLQRVTPGLFDALAAWRTLATHLGRLPPDGARQEAEAVLGILPPALHAALASGAPARWLAQPVALLRSCAAARQALLRAAAGTPSRRLLLDRMAALLAGLSHALAGLALLVAAPDRPRDGHPAGPLPVADWLPAWLNAGRAFLVILLIEGFWILTAWSNGAVAIVWATVMVTVFAPRAEAAYASAIDYIGGMGLAGLFAAVTVFGILPRLESFAGLAAALGLFLVPVGALMTQSWQAPVFSAMAAGFLPLVAPTNHMTYDAEAFVNNALPILVGGGFGVLCFRLLPPLPPARRADRLLALTLRDLRRLAAEPARWRAEAWEGRVQARLAALPDAAQPVQRGRLLAALAVGRACLALGRGAAGAQGVALGQALARGDLAAAQRALARIDQALAARDPRDAASLRSRADALVVAEALVAHPAWFGAV